LTVRNTDNLTASATVNIVVGSVPPIGTISAPAANSAYFPGQTVSYDGSAADPEDGPIAPGSLQWIVLLHHDAHVHVAHTSSGPSGSFNVDYHGNIGTFSYELLLTATDSTGLTSTNRMTIGILEDLQPPTTPTGLLAQANTGVINLSWTASTDNAAVSSYKIERSQGAGSTIYVVVGSAAATAFNDATINGDTIYNYRLAAVDASGNTSGYSTVATVTSLPGPSLPVGLVAAYGFNEGAGTSVTDASGNGNNGAIGTATWTAAGKFGQALTFNGSSAMVTVNDAPSLDLTTGMTLEAWVYPTAVGWWRDVIYKGPNDIYYLMGSSNEDTPAVGGTFAVTEARGASSLPLNTWTHLVGTYDGGTLRLYVNGVQVGSQAQTGLISTSTGALTIGGDALYGQYFAGRIDEVRMYNRALTVLEIQTNMTIPVEGGTGVSPEPSLEEPSPRFTSIHYGEVGGIVLTMAGEIGRTYVLEASSDLNHWIQVDVRTNTTGTLTFVDAATNIVRFYRAVSIPLR